MKIIEIRKDGSKRVHTQNNEPSMTDQQYGEQSDVNLILNKYAKTGQLTHVSKMQGQYADVSGIPDLHEALQNVKLANDSFMELPSDVRRRFMNSPALMIEFLNDSANDAEAIKLGLKSKPPKPEEPIEPKPKAPIVTKKDSSTSTKDS